MTSHHTAPHHITLHHITLHRTTSHHTTRYYTTSHQQRITPQCTTSHLITSHHMTSHPTPLSNPKPGHTTGGSGPAAHSGAAGRGELGRVGRRRFAQDTTVPRALRASKTTVVNIPSEARTREILCKPLEEQSPRLTTGLSAVCQRDEKRSLILAADQCNDAYLSL